MRLRGPAAALVILLVGLTACGGGPGASPSFPGGSSLPAASVTGTPDATGSGLPTAAETPSPSAIPSPTPTPAPALARLTLAEVTVATLNVRVSPSSRAKLLDVSDFPTVTVPLTRGARALILDGPVEAEGNRWYAVGLEQDPAFYLSDIAVGWIAAGADADPWLAPVSADCPKPGVQAIGFLSGVDRIACYGSDTISFAAHQAAIPPDAGLGGACQPPAGQPGWLVCDNIHHDWVNVDGGTAWLLLLHFDPATGIKPTGLADVGTTGPAYDVTGHFDDPAASACASASDPYDVTQLSAWLTCASKFVVEKLRKTG